MGLRKLSQSSEAAIGLLTLLPLLLLIEAVFSEGMFVGLLVAKFQHSGYTALPGQEDLKQSGTAKPSVGHTMSHSVESNPGSIDLVLRMCLLSPR